MALPLPLPRVPQIDLGASLAAHRADIDRAVARVLASGSFVLGPEVAAFEAEFADFLGGGGSVVSCASGTDAIELALRALGIGAGMAVATVSHTAVATVAAIERAGALPVLLESDPARFTLDVADLAGTLARGEAGGMPLKAVVAVHLYGQAVDLDALLGLCRAHGLKLVEDCSQAHGARHAGRTLGTIGDAGCFSFYPTKNLGALGDGGAIRVRDPAVAARLLALRQYGWDADRVSQAPGQNSRMDSLQAAILRAKLPHLAAANARRGAIAAAYDAALAHGAVRPPERQPGATHVFHQYVVHAPDRDALRSQLAADGIETAIHYPLPAHLHPAYRDRLPLGPAGCRAAADTAAHVLSLPMYPEMSDAQVDRVAAALAGLSGSR